MRRSAGFVLAFTVLVAGLSASATAAESGSFAFRPGATPYGVSYEEWALRFQQWTVSIPPGRNPLFDPTGRDCRRGQSGPVWFLTSTLGFSGTEVRDECRVPSDKAILLPVGTSACVATEPGDSAKAMAECARQITDGVSGLQADVDGAPIDVSAFRVETRVFTLTLAEHNVYGLPAGDYRPTVAGGFYVILKPLSPGRHTVHFSATYAGDPPATIDITYHLLVAPAT